MEIDWEEDDILSQSQIDVLVLMAMEELKTTGKITFALLNEYRKKPNEPLPEKYRNSHFYEYDFRRPVLFLKQQIREICLVFENFARDATRYLSAQYGKILHIHVASVDQLLISEYKKCVSCDKTFFKATWNGKTVIFSMGTDFALFSINPSVDQNYEFSDAEKNNRYSPVQKRFLNCVWKKLAFELMKKSFVINNVLHPNADVKTPVDIALPEEIQFYEDANKIEVEDSASSSMCILVTMEVRFNGKEDFVNIMLSEGFIKNVLIKKGVIMGTQKNTQDFSLEVVPGNSAVSLGQFNLPEGAKLKEGVIIELDKYAGEPVDLIDKKTGKVFARGDVVVIDENFSVRITEVLDKSLEA